MIRVCLGADDDSAWIGGNGNGGDLIHGDGLQDPDVIIVAFPLLVVVLVWAPADGELLDGSGLQQQRGVLAGGGGEDVGLDPHAVIVHTFIGDDADDSMTVVLPAKGHAVGIRALEEVVAGSRHDDIAPTVDVAESQGVCLDVQDTALLLGFHLQAGLSELGLQRLVFAGFELNGDAFHCAFPAGFAQK